MFFNEFSNGT